MDLRSHYPFWLMKNGIMNNYPSLQKDMHTEIAIIGGGITGALLAYHLVKAGCKVAVLERRHIGMGSTAASTALLQYEIDEPLHKLAEKVGRKNAEQSYLACYQSIDDLEKIIIKESFDAGFEKRPSLQYASFLSHVKSLEKESEARKSIGIPVRMFYRDELAHKFHFDAPAGIYSQQAAQVDAYRLTHEIFGRHNKHLEVYDKTEVVSIKHNKRSVELLASTGKKVIARKLVIACGYESQQYIPKPVEILSSTYAIVSEPLEEKKLWYNNALIWETKQPYLYMRTTDDCRVLVGGKDSRFSNVHKRDTMLPKKIKALENAFKKKFPGILFKTDFAWAGTFGSTKDALPYIGIIPERPNTYFALGLGGNGITFSIIAAQVIRDMINGITNPYENIFCFNR